MLSSFRLIVILIFTVIAYIVILPIVFLLYGSFMSAPIGQPGYFTLDNYVKVFLRTDTYKLLANTLIYAGGATLVSTLFGVILAYLTTKTNLPLRRFFDAIVVTGFLVPPLVTAIAWVFLLSPRIGLINLFLMNFFSLKESPLNVYSLTGMIFLHSLRMIPLVYFMVVPSLMLMDPSLEESAMICGSTMRRCFLKITLPLIKPAVLPASMLAFIVGIESFDIPLFIGIPAGIYVFPTKIYDILKTIPADYSLATTYSVLIVAITLIGVIYYMKSISQVEKFATVSGRSYKPKVVDIGSWRYPICGILLIILFSVYIAPLLVLLLISIVKFYVPSWEVLFTITLSNYIEVLHHPGIAEAITNSLFLSSIGATLLMVISMLIASIVHRTSMPGRTALEYISSIPIAFPGVTIAVALMWVNLSLPFGLYGTIWILLVGYMMKYIPYSYRFSTSSILQIHKELEESARVHGASWIYTIKSITLPLLKGSFIYGWIWLFIHMLRELPISLLLHSPGNEVLPVVIFRYYESLGFYEALSALCVMLLVFTFTPYFIMSRFVSK